MSDQGEDIERSIVGCMLVAGGSEDIERVKRGYDRLGLSSEWFNNECWKKLYQAIEEEWKEHHAVDELLVAERYGDGGADLVAEAIENTPSASHAEYYAHKIRDRRLYSLTRKLCLDTVKDVVPGNVSLVLDKLANGIREIQGVAAKADGGLARVTDYIESVYEKVKLVSDERFVKKNRRFYDGLPWPWEAVNQIYMGMKTGLHIVAALPSQGKTTMGVNLSYYWIKRGIPHGFICIDMTREELVKRYACLAKQVSLAKLGWGGSPEDVRLFREGLEEVGGSDVGVVEMSESNMAERIRDEAYRGVYTHGWKALIIDYLQLIEDDFRGKSATYEQVKQVTQKMKQLAKDLRVPIVCLVQLSRQAGKEFRETDRAPGLEDLGDSAEIARAASTVAVLKGDGLVKKHWAEYPPGDLAFGDRKNGDMGQVHLAAQLRPVWMHIIKNQQGPPANVPFVMYPNYFMFRPGDKDAPPEAMMIGGKDKMVNIGCFETLTDDWLHLEGDAILERTGAMGKRGVTYPGE